MKKIELLLLIFIVIAFGFFITAIFKKDPLIKPELLGINNSFSLKDTVTNALKDAKGTYAVVIKNMQTGKGYSINKDTVFEPGSLYKLWLMGAVFEKIKKGEIKEDEILSQDIPTLNKKFQIAKEDAELTEGTVTMSLSSALNQMIVISHNYAALMLLERVGSLEVTKFMESLGLYQSNLGTSPKTTASDIALFFEKLYKGELVSLEYSQRMIDLLKKQQLNDGLPKYLPKDVQIAHKTGEIGWFKHDGGIVFTNKGDYIIIVFSESQSPAGAQERIAQLSKAIFDYFNSNN